MKKTKFRFLTVILALAVGISSTGCGGGDDAIPSVIPTPTTSYTVTYDSNGATNGTAPSPQTAAAGSSITLASGSGLSKEGVLFSGWNTKADGTGTSYAAGTPYTVNASITLYAKWVVVPEGMVYISAGSFSMGQEGVGEATPVHQVTISQGFYMGKYEVTQAQFQAVMGTNPSYFTGDTSRPVEQVSWYDAIAYCNKLSIAKGRTPAYSVSGISDWAGLAYSSIPTSSNSTWDAATWNKDANGYRLPTEAEWEYACRAETTTMFNNGKNTIRHSEANFYPYSDGYDENPTATYLGRTTTVGSYSANAWGLYDMHGNVWEWCWDWYGSYSSDAQTDPAGASSVSRRVGRGGSWGAIATHLRSAVRGSDYQGDRAEYGGFRVVCP